MLWKDFHNEKWQEDLGYHETRFANIGMVGLYLVPVNHGSEILLL